VTERRRSAAVAVVLASLGVAGVFVDRAHGGLESHYITFVILLAGPLSAITMHARGRIPFVPWLAIGLDFASFTALSSYPFASWGVILGAVAAFLVTMGRSRGADVAMTRLDGAAPIAFFLLTLMILWRIGDHAGENLIACALLVSFGLEAWGPRASHRVGDVVRRMAALSLVAGSTVLHGYGETYTPFLSLERLVLLLGAIAIISSCMEASDPPPQAESVSTRAEPSSR
jgi:hypothetical protein